ncbi:MAG: PTS glucose transporter subunit IIA [Erysipelotrichaceae bacterium]|nr:PTS glucose transporter subunit IIA [Erysipelotrichaceae bacterium]
MALNYRKCAEEIFACLGGKDNIVSAAHCATRLRLVIADNSKIDKATLEEVEGVQGMFDSNGQLQLIIGTGTVNKVYDEFLAVSGVSAATKEEVKAAAAAKQPLPKRLVKALGDVFVPILPAIVASGLMMGIVESLAKAIPTFGASDWFSYLDMIANAAFVFLPGIIAVSAARVFGGNIYLGAVIGLLMIHPNLINAWNAANYDVLPSWKLLFFNVQQVGYQGHVIPVIIAVWLMSTIEKWLHKHVPEMIDLFVTPLVTVMVTSFLTFTIIGPIFSTAESYVLRFASWLITVGYGVGSLLMGAVYPWTVVMGLHHMYNAIEAGLLSSQEFGNLNIWMPIASAANFAQFGACLAVGLKTRNAKTKAVAVPSSLSAALGITEPAIFGVNFRFMKPFIFGMIGGALGAMFGSWMGLGATSYGVTGIPGYLIINNRLAYTILLAISGGVAFVLTYLFWHEEEKKVTKAVEKGAPQEVVISTEKGSILAPVNGKVISASEIPDAAFAGEMMGPSVGIEPEDGNVYAPFDGEVVMVFPTKHAMGLKADEGGMELLIHVGVDTVTMEGKGFETYVDSGAKFKKGDKLMSFDRKVIKDAGHPDTVIVALTNAADYTEVKKSI